MSKIEQWIADIDPDELPEPYRKLSGVIGLEQTLRLANEFQGASIYFPKLDNTLKSIRDKKIRDEFNGANYRELAHKYGLTVSWVRSIVSSNPLANGQRTLDDFFNSGE